VSNRRVIPPKAEAELNRCCEEGLTAHKARLRLALRGAEASDRTVARYMTKWRADRNRDRELREIGVGVGSVHANLGAIADVIRASVPGWRERQTATLRELFEQFLKQPTVGAFTAVVVGGHALVISQALDSFFGVKDA
jgi:hypothetical protein